MVEALDAGVAQVENAYKAAGMWDDTVTIFSMYIVSPGFLQHQSSLPDMIT